MLIFDFFHLKMMTMLLSSFVFVAIFCQTLLNQIDGFENKFSFLWEGCGKGFFLDYKVIWAVFFFQFYYD